MGRLRIEPKVKPLLTDEQYSFYKGILIEAQSAANRNHVYWDLEAGEKASVVRKGFAYVAEKEGIGLAVRSKRGSNSLQLQFSSGGAKVSSGRMSAEESRKRIVDALRSAGEPLQKSDLIAATSVSPSTWNFRIKELLGDGTVVRHGAGRQTTYSLP